MSGFNLIIMENKRTNYTIFVSLIAALGGLLFGFDTAVISGVIPYIETYFYLTSTQIGWVVSSLILGCIIGVLIAGFVIIFIISGNEQYLPPLNKKNITAPYMYISLAATGFKPAKTSGGFPIDRIDVAKLVCWVLKNGFGGLNIF